MRLENANRCLGLDRHAADEMARQGHNLLASGELLERLSRKRDGQIGDPVGIDVTDLGGFLDRGHAQEAERRDVDLGDILAGPEFQRHTHPWATAPGLNDRRVECHRSNDRSDAHETIAVEFDTAPDRGNVDSSVAIHIGPEQWAHVPDAQPAYLHKRTVGLPTEDAVCRLRQVRTDEIGAAVRVQVPEEGYVFDAVGGCSDRRGEGAIALAQADLRRVAVDDGEHAAVEEEVGMTVAVHILDLQAPARSQYCRRRSEGAVPVRKPHRDGRIVWRLVVEMGSLAGEQVGRAVTIDISKDGGEKAEGPKEVDGGVERAIPMARQEGDAGHLVRRGRFHRGDAAQQDIAEAISVQIAQEHV